MIYRILFFLFLVGTLQAKEDRLAPEAEPLALVHGCVNVVTGEFIQQETDLFIGGPSALLHSRIYDSGNSNVQSTIGSGFTWSIPRQIRFFTTYNKRTRDYEDNLVDGGTTIITMEEREGVSLVYQGRHNGKPAGLDGQEYTVRPSMFRYGYTNYSPWAISGATSLHNVTPLHRNYKGGKGGEFTVTLGCGTRRIYHCCKRDKQPWNLSQEIRPNGTKLFYEYDEQHTLRKAWLTDAEETTTIASYDVNYINSTFVVAASNGQTVRYLTDIDKNGYEYHRRLVKVEAEHLPKTEYRYLERVTAQTLGKVVRVTRPENRELFIGYYSSGRVNALYQLSGTEKIVIPIAIFGYGNNHCDVTGASEEWTRYLINPERRISRIQHYLHKKLHHQNQYFWGTEGKRTGNLLAKALCDPTGKAFSSKFLDYDDQGNITREILFGNLTGTGLVQFTLNAQGAPEQPVQGYAIERSYLPYFNVITEEKGGDGSYTKYCYKEGTNLLIAKLQGHPKYETREFFEYDKFAN